MPGGDPPRPADPDDWFAGSDPADPWSVTTVEPRVAGHEESGAADDWLERESVQARVDKPSEGFTVTLGTLLVVAAVVVVLIVLAGLALGGVFSGSSKPPPTNPTTVAASTTTRATSTTPTTTAARPTRPAVPAPTSTLKPGDRGEQVKVLQRALARLRYSTGAADGVYGPSTQAAVARFQKASALAADGVLGPRTLRALKRALGSSGD